MLQPHTNFEKERRKGGREAGREGGRLGGREGGRQAGRQAGRKEGERERKEKNERRTEKKEEKREEKKSQPSQAKPSQEKKRKRKPRQVFGKILKPISQISLGGKKMDPDLHVRPKPVNVLEENLGKCFMPLYLPGILGLTPKAQKGKKKN